jgi:Bifunctional DNA primase/polymerase, N-terminal/Primase C terminal 2 (PriCT-2)
MIINTDTDIYCQEISYQQQINKTAGWLTRHGIPVFPCLPNKQPATPNGFKDASIDVHRFDWDSNLLIGVPTGIRFDVLDVDYQHVEAQAWCEQYESQIPDTRIHLTKSGGFHVFFRPDSRVGNTTSRIGKHIDTRGKGGYIIWWPAFGFPIWNSRLIAPWPEWLIPPPPNEVPPPLPENRTTANCLDVVAALDAIDSNCDYLTWFEILVGLKAELGDNGFVLARDWSLHSNKYPGDAAFARKWKSIVPQRYTIRTIFYHAFKTNPNWKTDFIDQQFTPKENNNDIIGRI